MSRHDSVSCSLKSLMISGFLLGYFLAVSQISSVNYQLKYNRDSCWYDAYLIINTGSATSVSQRTQESSKLTVIVPTGTSIDVIRNYMPLKNNALLDGTEPNEWVVNSIVGAPTITPESDYYRFAPSLDDTSHYNIMHAGDTIQLFSFVTDTIFNCGSGIRLFSNGIDPGPLDPGMGFINFSNKFNLAEGQLLYNQNSVQVNPAYPDLSIAPLLSCQTGIEIDITASTNSCQSPLSFHWSGPASFFSDNEDIFIPSATTNNSGNYKVVVLDKFGCRDSLQIYAQNKPFAGDDLLVCAGTSVILSGSNPTTGFWASSSSNAEGASLTPLANGIVQVNFSLNAFGDYSFIYNNLYCTDTVSVFVNPIPTVSITGDSGLCIGAQTTLFPQSDGYWASNNPTLATVNNQGVVTALNSGLCTFKYIDYASGCDATTPPVTVYPKPTTEITGTPELCIGSFTSILPSDGGNWTSLNTSVGMVTNTGIASGISEGILRLMYTNNNTGCISDTLNIVVNPIPEIHLDGPNIICINAATRLFPHSGGTWLSLQPNIATVTNDGLVMGEMPGQTSFIWTQTSTGCSSSAGGQVNVISGPEISSNTESLCVGSTALLYPNNGGIWMSNNPDVAVIGTVNGVVSGLSAGVVTFTFTRNSDGCSTTSQPLEVRPRPVLSAGTTNLCVGSVTNLIPSSGGEWSSLDDNIVGVTNPNLAVGTGQGIVGLRYSDSLTGCQNTISFNVTARVAVFISESNEICKGSNTSLSPSSGGTWTSSNVAVANVTSDGIVTGIDPGSATFIFTETSTGCNSLPTFPVIVHPLPLISLAGPDSICISSNTNMTTNIPGTWTSDNPAIAGIDALTGTITGEHPGSTSFYVQAQGTGCMSEPSPPVNVIAIPDAIITGSYLVCVGSTTQLSPVTGGNWVSNNPSVASVNNNGLVVAVAAGNATFTFTETAHGCGYLSTSDTIRVTPCFNPDINLTTINTSVTGDVSSNDYNSSSNTYSADVTLISSPIASQPVINVQIDGKYTFTADYVGIYIYEIPVCIYPLVSSCPASRLTISVTDNFKSGKTIVANGDFITTSYNTPVTIHSLANDACIAIAGCLPDPSSVSIISPPALGSATVNPINGDITFIPSSGFIGVARLTYKVCASGDLTNCMEAIQEFTVSSPTVPNILTAGDDVGIVLFQTQHTGNVLLNDYDPEGDLISVMPQSIVSSKGSFALYTDGVFTYQPAQGFFGPVHYTYEICDNNTSPVCVKANIYLLVLPDFAINVRVYLEGALMNNGNISANGRPLMRDNLRISPFTGERVIPDTDPYANDTEFIYLSDKYRHVYPGDNIEFRTIVNPASVFGVSGADAIVDWVFVELRSKTSQTNIVATRSGLLQRDGDIVDIDGASTLRFPGIAVDSYYVVIRHRNHLGIMSKNPVSPQQLLSLMDFTSPFTPTFDFGTSKGNGLNYEGLGQKNNVKAGYMALWAGDFDANKKIKNGNPNDDLNILFFEILIHPQNYSGSANYDFTIGYYQGDFDMNSKAKFDNPGDDKNMIFAQTLFYPLNIMTLSNFDYIIEQIP